MSPVEKTMPTPKAPGQPMNVWMIVSIVLAIALVAAIAFAVMGNSLLLGNKGADDMVIVKSDVAANGLIDFVNEVYGDRVGQVTLKGVAEKNGLYEVTFLMTDATTGQPADQIVFVTKDGKIFIPQVIDIAEMREQFKQFQAQQQAAPAAAVPTEGVEAETAAAEGEVVPTPAE